jgi:hypothetical protein
LASAPIFALPGFFPLRFSATVMSRNPPQVLLSSGGTASPAAFFVPLALVSGAAGPGGVQPATPCWFRQSATLKRHDPFAAPSWSQAAPSAHSMTRPDAGAVTPVISNSA